MGYYIIYNIHVYIGHCICTNNIIALAETRTNANINACIWLWNLVIIGILEFPRSSSIIIGIFPSDDDGIIIIIMLNGHTSGVIHYVWLSGKMSYTAGPERTEYNTESSLFWPIGWLNKHICELNNSIRLHDYNIHSRGETGPGIGFVNPLFFEVICITGVLSRTVEISKGHTVTCLPLT